MPISAMDWLFSKLLKLPMASGGEQIVKELQKYSGEITNLEELIKIRMEVAIFWGSISKIVEKIMENGEVPNAEKEEVQKNWANFNKIGEKVQKYSHRMACEFWKFWRYLDQRFDDNESHQNGSVEEHFGMEIAQEIDFRQVDCGLVEEFIQSPNPETEARKMSAKIIFNYLNDVMMAKWRALGQMLRPAGEEQWQRMISVGEAKGPNKVQFWKFSEYFDPKRLDNESNFVHQMRILNIKNREKNWKKLLTIKLDICRLIGVNLLEELEFAFPIIMTADILDDDRLSVMYMELLGTDYSTTPTKNEIKLGLRVYMGRLWTIFVRINTMKKGINRKKFEEIDKIDAIWDKKLPEFFEKFVNIDENALVAAHQIWLKLMNAHNKMPNLKAEQKMETPEGKAENKVQVARDELIEDHIEIMSRLWGTRNKFSEYWKNCPREARIRLRNFLVPDTIAENGQKKREIFDLLVKKHPVMVDMLRSEFSHDQLNQLQIRLYITFFDSNSSEKLYKWAGFHADILAYYWWFQVQSKGLASASKKVFSKTLAIVEIWLDFEHEFVDGVFTAEAANQFVEMFEMVRNNLDVEKGTKVRDMHEAIIDKLLIGKDSQFRNRLKGIFVDKQRLHITLGSESDVIQRLISESRGLSDQKNVKYQIPNILRTSWEQLESELLDSNAEITPVKEDYDAHELMMSYHRILLEEQPISAEVKELINIYALYSHHKKRLGEIMTLLGNLKAEERDCSSKFAKMVSVIEREEAEADLDAVAFGSRPKTLKLCQMYSLMERILKNGTLCAHNAKWREMLGVHRRGTMLYAQNGSIPQSSDADYNWLMPNCENSSVSIAILKRLQMSPNIEQTHMHMLNDVHHKYPKFLDSVRENPHKWPTVRNFLEISDQERIGHYERILGSEMDIDNPNESEAEFYVKLLIKVAGEREKELGSGLARRVAGIRTGTFAFLRLAEIFAEDRPRVRMVCLMVNYLEQLQKMAEMPEERASIKLTCYSESQGEIMWSQREHLAGEHAKFLEKYLQNCEKNAGIVQILLDKSCCPHAKSELMLGTKAMRELWGKPKIQEKLMDPDCKKFESESLLEISSMEKGQ